MVVAGRDDLNDSELGTINGLLRTLSLNHYEPRQEHFPAPTGPPLARYGMSMRLPQGWEGRISRGLLQASGDGLRVEFREHGGTDAPFVTSRFPIQVVESEFIPAEPGQAEKAGVNTGGSFSVNGRDFVFRVTSNEGPPPRDALERLDGALKTLQIERGDFYPGSVDPATFAAAPGWYTGTSGAAPIEADGQQTSTWAATIPYRDEPFQFPPSRTLERLPKDGVIILTDLFGPNNGAGTSAPFHLPPLPRHLDPNFSFEGLPSNVGGYGAGGRVDDEYQVSLTVLFDERNPSAFTIARAQAELDRLRLPDWSASSKLR
jgi:hypothetical protein